MLLSILDFAEAQTEDWKTFQDPRGAGIIQVEQSVYVLKNNHDDLLVNVKGKNIYHSPGDKFELWLTYPSETEVEFEIAEPAIKDNGVFNNVFLLSHGRTEDERILPGTYKISILGEDIQIGSLTFEIKYDQSYSPTTKNPSTYTPPPPPLYVPSDQSKSTMETDLLSYNAKDTVMISGVINQFDPDKPQSALTLTITDSKGSRVEVGQINPDFDGKFSYSYKIGKTVKQDGQYTVLAAYEEEQFTTTFNVKPLPPVPQIHKRAFIEMEGFSNLFDFGLSKFQNQNPDIQFENNYGRTIHIYKDGKTVRDLFNSLNIGITAQCITGINSGRDFCSDSTHELKFSVNYKNIKILSNYVIEEGDLIKIQYKKLATNPAPVNPVPKPQPVPTPTPAPQQSSSGASGTDQLIDPKWIAILLIITGAITIIIVAVNRINKKPKKNPKQSVTKQRKPRGSVTTPTILFYECPQCHNPDINNNSDGTATCDACGFKN